MIHRLADVSPQAELGNDVTVGPFSVVEQGTQIGDGCQLASHVVIKDGTSLGAGNRVHEGAILGGLPQHMKPIGHPGRLQIGDDNVIREHATIHRSLSEDGTTFVGSGGLLMVGCHIAHDCRVGDRVVMTNHVLLAGHVTVGDGVYFGGAAAVHQFCRVGRLAMVGGLARITQDVPPFVTVDGGTTRVVGINVVGLRRSGMLPREIEQLKAAYRLIYREGLTWQELLVALRARFTMGPSAEYADFFETGSRGFVQERRPAPGATIRLHRDSAAAASVKRAG